MSGPTTTSGRSGGSRRPTLTGRLARVGFADISRSAGLLADPDLALLLDGGRPPGADGEAADPASAVDDELLAAFGAAADPDLALLQVVRLAGTLRPDVEARAPLADLARRSLRPGEARDRLLAVLGASVALGDDVVRRPASLEVLADPTPGTGVDVRDVRAELLRAA
ncbi:MAG: bifunctional [glutamine synthetase] adenylyltransferase/[glutamine synthetase]-adenylyl-L-tyrosine phosphorylase, partial [Cellulosimicrobium cellulans]